MIRPFLLFAVATSPWGLAQDIAPKDSERDPVLSALTEGFGEGAGIDGIPPEPLPLAGEESGAPVLVTGRPPEGAEIEETEPVAPEPEGVTVEIEPGKGGSEKVDAAAVKLLAPFPAKPLFQPPSGWRLEHPEEIPAFTREVPLSNGTRISLSIRPHLLVPDADGENVIGIQEPGYDPALGYAQTGTMSAVLSDSVARMEEDSRKLSEALDRLGQLLGSLPSPEPPAAKAVPSPEKKKR